MKAKTSGSIVVSWGAEHGSKGKLISRQASVEAPSINCVRLSCLWKFAVKSLAYVLAMLYHKYRVEYAEKNRNKEIPVKYRTGEEAPESVLGLIFQIIKLRR